ncbi:MAG: RtcB family protein [Bacteroidales bacterium]|nr:RtcB family protein [Bacteroidales bacterium]
MNNTIEKRNVLALKGKWCKDCIIFTEDIEEEAVETIGRLLGNPLFRDSRIRVMPDVHAGKGIVIGFTCPVSTFINPSHVGLDIGCGIDLIFFDRPLPAKDYPIFEHRVRKEIPTGFSINKTRQFEMKGFLKYLRSELDKARQSAAGLVDYVDLSSEEALNEWIDSVGMDKGQFYKSIGSIGGGNQFREYDEGDGRYAFTVHTGSRHLGLKVFRKWDIIAQSNPNNPGYLVDEDFKGYLTDMVIAQAYARFNRKIILDKAAAIMHKISGAKVIGSIETAHNYVDFRDMVLRKGAIRSYEGELMVIPFNMRDGIAVCEGRSNPEWNFSAPHGSGRRMSRADARRHISVADYHDQMKGVYSTCINLSTIDEAPEAYKDTESILESLGQTCTIHYRMMPKINIKAADE